MDNREKLPQGINIPNIYIPQYENKTINKYKITISSYFDDNPGSLSSFNFPIKRSQAEAAFHNSLQYRLKNFGKYEDAISVNDTYLFHSVLNPYLNIGLTSPKDILALTLDYSKENKIPMNSFEGFIRRIIGWREFVHGTYFIDGLKQRNRNYWKFNNTLPKSFYDGKTSIYPVDNTIKKVLNHAYCHHIERLMILGNIMVHGNVY